MIGAITVARWSGAERSMTVGVRGGAGGEGISTATSGDLWGVVVGCLGWNDGRVVDLGWGDDMMCAKLQQEPPVDRKFSSLFHSPASSLAMAHPSASPL